MKDSARFQDKILQELQNPQAHEHSLLFERFVRDLARCGIGLDQLVEATRDCASGGELLVRVERMIVKAPAPGSVEDPR